MMVSSGVCVCVCVCTLDVYLVQVLVKKCNIVVYKLYRSIYKQVP